MIGQRQRSSSTSSSSSSPRTDRERLSFIVERTVRSDCYVLHTITEQALRRSAEYSVGAAATTGGYIARDRHQGNPDKLRRDHENGKRLEAGFCELVAPFVKSASGPDYGVNAIKSFGPDLFVGGYKIHCKSSTTDIIVGGYTPSIVIEKTDQRLLSAKPDEYLVCAMLCNTEMALLSALSCRHIGTPMLPLLPMDNDRLTSKFAIHYRHLAAIPREERFELLYKLGCSHLLSPVLSSLTT